jgi:hypothetical protein
MGAETVGIRIGLDHGPKDKVLWAAYGYPQMEEVTATSFHVDVAAKLQQAAGTNEIMVGQTLRDLLDLPDVVLEKKTFIKDGQRLDDPYVMPNYSLADGSRVNYKKYVLRWQEYLKTTQMAAAAPALVGLEGEQLRVTARVAHAEDRAKVYEAYLPSSRMLPKERSLLFEVRLHWQPRVPFTVDFSVENHGEEANRVVNNGNHSSPTQEKTRTGDLTCEHWESTRYRGLHYLNVIVRSPGKRASRRVGVWVE